MLSLYLNYQIGVDESSGHVTSLYLVCQTFSSLSFTENIHMHLMLFSLQRYASFQKCPLAKFDKLVGCRLCCKLDAFIYLLEDWKNQDRLSKAVMFAASIRQVCNKLTVNMCIYIHLVTNLKQTRCTFAANKTVY